MNEQANISGCIIICPNCAAQFQVAPDLIGKSGRKVRCANCHNDWRAFVEETPSSAVQDQGEKADSGAEDKSGDEGSRGDEPDEDEMDARFKALERENRVRQNSDSRTGDGGSGNDDRGRAGGKKTGPGSRARERADMAWRKRVISRSMPRARMRRVVRIAGGATLAMVLFLAVVFREDMVRAFPDLAGIYEWAGLGVNVVGLEFSNVKTLKSISDGVEVLNISADINSVSSGQVSVPRVVVSLLDEGGESVFDWSITPRADVMLPGEMVRLETQLSAPPRGASLVRLTFEKTN